MNYRAHIDIDAPEYAAKNYPTEDYNLRPTGEIRGGRVVRSRPELVQRRSRDCVVWDMLDQAQTSAVEDIHSGWREAAPSSGIKNLMLDGVRVDGTRGFDDLSSTIDFRGRYLTWRAVCDKDRRLRAGAALVIKVFFENDDLRTAERAVHVRNGTARDLMPEAINVHIKEFGAR